MEFQEDEYNEILNIFQVESEEIISRLNNSLVELEKKPNNKDIILLLFRDAHSLKGASRMIEFNNVQTLAHKIEDILGLAKENKLQLNAKIADILYKTVDFISELIQASIANKKEVYNENISIQMELLDNIRNFEEQDTPAVEGVAYNVKILTDTHERVNALITEALVCLMRIEVKLKTSLLDKLLACATELFHNFANIGFFEIKMSVENIKVKLEFVKNASYNLTMPEIQEMQNELNNVITNYTSVCEMNYIPPIDYYSLAFEQMSKEPHVVDENLNHDINPEEQGEFCEPYDLTCIKDKISTLYQNMNNINDIRDFLINFEKYHKDTDINKIIHNIVKILDFSEEKGIQLDEETVSVLKQSIDYCDNRIKNKNEIGDTELVFQRLEIVQQLLELNTNSKDELELPERKGFTLKTRKIADFTKIFDTGEIKTLRVDSHKLDILVNQIGELIITKIKTKKHLQELEQINKSLEEWQRNFTKAVNHLKYYDKKHFQYENDESTSSFFVKQLLNLFAENNKTLSKTIYGVGTLHRTIQEDDMKISLIVDDLENMVKNIRVLPLATVFHLFGRMVRDIAKEKNKKVELEIIGSETSADKKIIEEIKTPLIHIIRNAIDHGIETPAQRTALGKDPTGKIIISAKHQSNKVLIDIIDDGQGVNLEKIKEKALSNGFLTAEEINSMSDEDITNIIFWPGFTTGEEVTNISGRGIGLDVVQTKISQLNGKVKVISEINKGSVVQIELPVTMATLKAFLVKSAEQTFAIPMPSINTVVRKKAEEIQFNRGNRSILFNDRTIPLYYLSDILNLKTEAKSQKYETVLILESDNKLAGLAVEKLLGDQEIIHKKLSAPLYKLKNISGLTTLASGEICLILNIPDLLKTASASQAKDFFAPSPKMLPDKALKFANRKILLVDDSLTTRTLEKNILSAAGYFADIATNPIEALEKMKNTGFDLIISDIEMPEMDGFEFLQEIKSDEMYADIPVIMVSSISSPESQKKSRKLKAEAFIVKGEFNQQIFLELVENTLEKYYG